MNKILVLDNGQVVEHGTHQELLKQAGHYRRLWDLQSQILDEENRLPIAEM